jgi:hypothetical protein
MEIGRCPACDLPYTAREVAGLGILRSRPESLGGPVVEYRCAGCDGTIPLVPHGDGRYAPRGAPVPEPVPPEDRAPPWAGARRAEERGRGASRPPSPPPRRPPPAPERHVVTPPPEGEPLTLAQALEVLGIGPTADRAAIERAYRDRSVQCHPDKVAHLDPEFQALAERKFRRLREAYDMLTR